MIKKVVVTFLFDSEEYDLDAITKDFVVSALKERGFISDDGSPEVIVSIETVE